MPNSPFFSINDDKGNPIYKSINRAASEGNHIGESRSTDKDGKKYPKGFTPPVDFYTDSKNTDVDSGLPVEYGVSLTKDGEVIDSGGKMSKTDGLGKINEDSLVPSNYFVDPDNINPDTGLPVEYGNRTINDFNALSTDEKIDDRKSIYDNFNDFAGKEFTHLLDYFIDQNGDYSVRKGIPNPEQSVEDGSVTLPNTSNIYLGSFIRTTDDNEDPTMLGYDIEIKYNSSPLFNGTIDSFISQFGQFNSEIASRKEILENFKSQIFKFLKNDSPSTANSPKFLNGVGAKIYYLKNMSGLNNLVESSTSDKIKSFNKYGEEYITLQFWEDVSQNMGYLASLYKSLAWSRINGKQVIPENLLRFDIDITVTEVRKFNRLMTDIGDPNKITVYADLVSKYTYSLYECQLFFPEMPHSDSIDMSNTKIVENYDVKFNYKFSTMKFTKFFGPTKPDYVLDNSYIDMSKVKSKDTTNSSVGEGGTITSSTNSADMISYDSYPKETSGLSLGSAIDDIKNQDKSKKSPLLSVPKSADLKKAAKKSLGKNKPFDQLKKNLANALVREVNRQILTQAALLNKTLENIRNSIPYAGRMSEPTNVYSSYNIPFRNDVINSLRDFVGGSIKGFFQKP